MKGFNSKMVRRLQRTLKEITKITTDGIHYVDEAGNQQFIDFETCYQNNLMEIQKREGSNYTDEEKEFWQEMKYVGVRFALTDPPAVWFYTVPLTKFEFSTIDALSEVLVGVKKAGWRTRDGE